jgi:hypothetical protein
MASEEHSQQKQEQEQSLQATSTDPLRALLRMLARAVASRLVRATDLEPLQARSQKAKHAKDRDS